MGAAKKLTWTPKRTGNIYCSSACGHDCKWSEYQTAKRRARTLARRLGKGWIPNVWENLGWHYEALSPCRRLKVHGHHGVFFRGSSYTAFLGEPDCGGGRWSEGDKNPEGAIRKVIAAAKKDLRKIGAFLKGLPEIG